MKIKENKIRTKINHKLPNNEIRSNSLHIRGDKG
jgi:hypothetical protein